MVLEDFPTLESQPETPVQPDVRLTVEYPARLSRWRLFFKWLFAFPLFFWVAGYGFLTLPVTFIAFWAIVFTGVYPRGLFIFVRGYLAAQARVYAYFPLLITDRWRQSEPHPVGVVAEPPARTSRRLLLLKAPLYLVQSVTSVASIAISLGYLVAFPAWFAILITGRYPRRLFRIQSAMLQWSIRLQAWQLLMNDDWRMWGETRKVRVVTGLGVLAYCVINPLLFVSFLSGGGFSGQLADIFGFRDAQVVVEQFIEAGVRNDVDGALALSVPDRIARQEVVLLFGQRAVFEGFRDTTLTSWRRNASSGQPDSMELAGSMRYEDGTRRSFQALLQKIDGEWNVLLFRVASTRR